MTRQEAFANLRNVLANLYPNGSNARRIVDDAGLNSLAIDFSGSAINTWHAILSEAENANKMESLLQVVLREYEGNVALRTAYEAYQGQMQTTSGVSSGGTSDKLNRLSGSQFKQFQNALLSAFTQATLEQMVTFELDERLNVIAGGSNLGDITFNLISWAQQTGNLDRLLDGALATVPGNTELRAFAKAVRGN